MSKIHLATRYNFEFCDGSTCEMTLAFIQLKRLSSKNKALYESCQKVMTNGGKNEFDILTVLYTAYICANMESENLLTEDEFIEKCGSDREAISDAFIALTTPKKQKASVSHSS